MSSRIGFKSVFGREPQNLNKARRHVVVDRCCCLAAFDLTAPPFKDGANRRVEHRRDLPPLPLPLCAPPGDSATVIKWEGIPSPPLPFVGPRQASEEVELKRDRQRTYHNKWPTKDKEGKTTKSSPPLALPPQHRRLQSKNMKTDRKLKLSSNLSVLLGRGR